MHFANYISLREAKECVKRGIKKISVTPTAARQTSNSTFKFLKKNGIEIEELKRQGRPRKLSKEEVRRILAIRHSKVSFYKIAEITGVAKSTVFDYCKRYKGKRLGEDEVIAIQIKEARNTLKDLLDKDLSEEINELARKGYNSRDVNEITEILWRIEDRIFNSE
jgi:hypothetical protein